MFLIYFLILHTKSQKIVYDCNLINTDFKEFQNQSIELEISCPENQIIYLNNINSIRTISVFKKSNVILSCSPNSKKLNNISLYIFNNPQINFEDNCKFDSIEIYGIPTFRLLQSAYIISKNVITYIDTNVFESDDMIYFEEKYETNSENFLKNIENSVFNDEIILTNYADDGQFTCSDFIVNLTDVLFFECDQNNFTINYSEIPDYNFILNNSYFYIYNLNSDTIPHFETILKQSTFSGQIDAFFVDIYNTTKIMDYVKMINHDNIQIWMKISWEKIMNNITKYCEWECEDYKDEFLDLKKHFDFLDEKSDWRKVCYQNYGYLIHQQTKGEVIVIPVVSSWIIIIVIVLLIIGICISVFFISLHIYG